MASGPLFNGYHANGVLCLPEDEDDSNSLVYSNDGVLISGSLDSLILHLVPTGQYYPEPSYVFAFLLGSRLFLEPLPLMNRVCQTCITQQGLKSDRVCSGVLLEKFGKNMISLLGKWTDNFPYDFLDDLMIKCLKDMTKLLVDLIPDLRREVTMLMQNLCSKIAYLNKYKEILTRIDCEANQKLQNMMPAVPQVEISEVCPHPLVLGEQLTHIELERLSMIGPEEFMDDLRKSRKSSDSKEECKKTSNIDPYVQWYNRLSYLVATEICVQLKKKNRVRIIEYFVDVAKECVNIGNFNSLMAIIGGLNMSSVQRLKKTWAKVNKEKFEILEHQSNPVNNFGNYRSSLKAALWRSAGASDDRQKIVVPFFSLLVKDMLIIHEGNENTLQNGHVNFEKLEQFSRHLKEFMSWKSVDCPFERHPAILNYLLTNPVLSENSLALASYECEQPDNSYERQHYKQLKTLAGKHRSENGDDASSDQTSGSRTD